MNSKKIIQYTSSNQFPAEEMIQIYKEHLGWICITYIEDELKQTRTYEMLVRNDKNIIKSLEFAYKYLPYKLPSMNDSNQREGINSKRLIILEELAKKQQFRLRKLEHIEQ